MHTNLPAQSGQKRLLLPKAPVLVADGLSFCVLTVDGALEKCDAAQARKIVQEQPVILCHGHNIARRLQLDRLICYDVLELFAFVHPGQFCVPTPRGIAKALHLMEGESAEDQCLSLRDCARHLLTDLMQDGREEKTNPAPLAAMMGLMGAANDENGAGWLWALPVLAALGRDKDKPTWHEMRGAMRVWDKLPEWSVHAPEGQGGHLPVTDAEAQDRLHKLLLRQKKEDRPQQQDYSRSISGIFSPKDTPDDVHVVMAEAGTGTGKTMGYLAPATVWAEKNGAPVWVSTFTRNLQKQVEAELENLYDDPVTKSRKVVTRKGRENYLCLLNLEDASQSQSIMTNDINAVALGLMIRWAGVTDDGDLMGKDFPGWLASLLGWHRVYSFADRRGECIYAACPHFDKCFVEKSVRKAKRADIVIANHALVMHQSAIAAPEDDLPTRYIFDEGHHIFEAADNAYGATLNGQSTADLRRWILGVETERKTRARGIKKRIEDLITDDDGAQRDLDAILEAARALPGPQWRQRLSDNQPKGLTEAFLALCAQQVLARNAQDMQSYYSLETQVAPAIPGFFEAAYALQLKLQDLQRPMNSLCSRLTDMLSDEAQDLDSATRERIRYVATSLFRRARQVVGPWIDMLKSLSDQTPQGSVDWLEITRADGKDVDTGFYRYYTDPAAVFAAQIKPHAHGMAITSATLRDKTDADEAGWQSPLARAGVHVLTSPTLPPDLFDVASPFDYATQTRVLVVRDVDKNSPDEVAAAYRELFKASQGGGLGIFTSVQRLKAVHQKIIAPLENAHIHLYAQHVDPLDTGTLIDIFREEENACLLGTDATRDGIDVPGRALRLVVYDRVPWPKPTLLHKARREHFGKTYDDMLTRFKLKQAYGRLIRKSTDKGIFVMLDGALPTRLCTAFPHGAEIERIGLKEAIDILKGFY